MRAVLDTSVLIGDDAPGDVEAAISVVSLTAALRCPPGRRGRRTGPADRSSRCGGGDLRPVARHPEVARAWGRLAAAVSRTGGRPRPRQIDPAIAATAAVERVPLLTHDVTDLEIIRDLVDVRRP